MAVVTITTENFAQEVLHSDKQPSERERVRTP